MVLRFTAIVPRQIKFPMKCVIGPEFRMSFQYACNFYISLKCLKNVVYFASAKINRNHRVVAESCMPVCVK